MLSGRTPEKRVGNINIRIDPSSRDLIDRASHVVGKTRSAFMIEASAKLAEEVILDHEQWDQFNKMLNQSPSVNKNLKKLLMRNLRLRCFPFDKLRTTLKARTALRVASYSIPTSPLRSLSFLP